MATANHPRSSSKMSPLPPPHTHEIANVCFTCFMPPWIMQPNTDFNQ